MTAATEATRPRNARGSAKALAPLTAANVVTALVLAKVLALRLGPTGTGRYFLALAVMSFGGMLASLGLGPALTNVVARHRAADAPLGTDAHATLRRALVRCSVAGAFVGAGIVALPVDAGGNTSRLLVAAGVLPSAWFLVLQGALRGTRDFGLYARVGVAFAVANLSCTAVGAVGFGVNGAIGGSVLVALAGAGASSVAVRRALGPSTRVASAASVRSAALAGLGASALAALLAASAGQAAGRWYVADSLGIVAAGYFAAAWSISNRVPSLVYQTYSAYLAPTLSALTGDWAAIRREQRSALRIGLLIATPLLLVLAAAMGLVVPLLLSSSFRPMEGLLRWMLVGEVVSVWYWSLSSALFPVGRTIASAAAEWLWWLLFLGGSAILVHSMGIEGVGCAYLLAYVLMSLALLAYEARSGFRPDSRSACFVVCSVGAVACTAWLGEAVAVPAAGVAAPALLGWAAAAWVLWRRGTTRFAIGTLQRGVIRP